MSETKPPVSLATMNDTEGTLVRETPAPAQGAVIPPAAVPWLTALVAAALITAKSAPVGSPVQLVADSLVDVAVLFGLASPGWRRK